MLRWLLPSLICWLLMPGCATRFALQEKSPLVPPKSVKNTVILDVLFVRYSPQDHEFRDAVWGEVDELHFPPELRRRLDSNGFRVGVLSGPLPLALESRLQLASTAPAGTTPNTPLPVDLEKKSATRQRQLRIGGGRRANILVLGERERLPELTMLMREDDGRVEGRTFQQVQGLFATKAYPQGDGTVKLELTPELEHGKPQKRFIPGDGMFHVEFGPPHEIIDQLRCTANLAPGQIIAISAHLERPGSLGYQFFTESEGGKTEHKMLLVRLAHTEFDDRFSTTPAVSPENSQP